MLVKKTLKSNSIFKFFFGLRRGDKVAWDTTDNYTRIGVVSVDINSRPIKDLFDLKIIITFPDIGNRYFYLSDCSWDIEKFSKVN